MSIYRFFYKTLSLTWCMNEAYLFSLVLLIINLNGYFYILLKYKTLNKKNIFLLIIYVLFIGCKDVSNTQNLNISPPEGMIWVSGKSFTKGGKVGDNYAMERELPSHEVYVDGFFIDVTEVTNKQFEKFVQETGYITIAERKIEWEEIKKNLPPNTPKPPDSVLQPGSLIFNKEIKKVDNMGNYFQWWKWKIGANWKQPLGPGSTIVNMDNFPVVHVAYEDALAYCEWAGRRLPTEAEWESAAQGNFNDAVFSWGNEFSFLNQNANTWQGNFPIENTVLDKHESIAAVKSYPPNSIGVYDMIGNVWEITSDLFNVNHYKELDLNKSIKNPKGASSCYNPSNPYELQYIMKGGSFLCHDSYCASYRISARMGVSIGSASDHMGFRTVATLEMLNRN